MMKEIDEFRKKTGITMRKRRKLAMKQALRNKDPFLYGMMTGLLNANTGHTTTASPGNPGQPPGWVRDFVSAHDKRSFKKDEDYFDAEWRPSPEALPEHVEEEDEEA